MAENQLIKRALVGAFAVLLLVSLAAPTFAQSEGAPSISLSHQYVITTFGDGLINDTITFNNNGSSSVQIPTLHLGIPTTISSHAAGFRATPNDLFSLSTSVSGNTTVVTVSPDSPTLAPGSSVSVSVATYLVDALNSSTGSAAMGVLLLLSPSLDTQVDSLSLSVVIPSGGTIAPTPSNFTSQVTTPPSFTRSENNTTPVALTQQCNFTDTSPSSFQPVRIYSLSRTITPSLYGTPQVTDVITFQNLASYSMTSLLLNLLGGGTSFKVLPSTNPPLIDPTALSLVGGAIDFTSPPFGTGVAPGDNMTLTIIYPLASSLTKTSGDTVSVSVPWSSALLSAGVVENYTISLFTPTGFVSSGPTKVSIANATSLSEGSSEWSYSLSLGWAAQGAMPIAALAFVGLFAVLALRKDGTEEEPVVPQTDLIAELIKALEDKMALLSQSLADFSGRTQGVVGRSEFVRVRNELDSLKAKALQRLNQERQASDSDRYLEALGQIQEAEREEDKAAKDIVNLYEQYQSKRMREETFQRLLPAYRKRLDSATNHLSEVLNKLGRAG